MSLVGSDLKLFPGEFCNKFNEINRMLDLIIQHRFTDGYDIFKQAGVFIPLCQNGHWFLFHADMMKLKVSIYDTLLDVSRKAYFDDFMRYLTLQAAPIDSAPANTEFKPEKWKFINRVEHVPQQTNSVDCGVYVIALTDLLSMDIPMFFGQDDIPLLRQKLCLQLLDSDSLSL